MATPDNMIGLFKLLTSDDGNMLTGSAINIDFAESSSFRIQLMLKYDLNILSSKANYLKFKKNWFMSWGI